MWTRDVGVREEGGTPARESNVSVAAGDSAGLHGMELLGSCPDTLYLSITKTYRALTMCLTPLSTFIALKDKLICFTT